MDWTYSWITPRTDRTLSDVLNRTDKGRYTNDDLNRVENNNGYLAQKLREAPIVLDEYRATKGIPYDAKYYPDYDPLYNPHTKIDWETWDLPSGPFVLNTISEMMDMVGITALIPLSLKMLNYVGANNIEAAQAKILDAIGAMIEHYKGIIDEDSYTEIYGGMMTAINENELYGGEFITWDNNGEISGGNFNKWEE